MIHWIEFETLAFVCALIRAFFVQYILNLTPC